MTEEFANEVYNMDTGQKFDRTTAYAGQRRMRYDIDFRARSASNPMARQWTYGASCRNLEKAKREAEKLRMQIGGVETRIVDSFSGKVVH